MRDAVIPAQTAILGLLYGIGSRRSELVQLDVADFDSQDGVLTIRGKGNEAHTSHVVEEAGTLKEYRPPNREPARI